MTASAGSGASAVALGLAAAAEDDADGDASAEDEAEAEAASDADAAADAVAAALGVAAGLADCGGATEAGVALQAPASSMTTAPRATIRFLILGLAPFDDLPGCWAIDGWASWITDAAHLPPSLAGLGPRMRGGDRDGTPCTGIGIGRQDVHDPLDELLPGQSRCRAKPIQLPKDRAREGYPGMADPAAEDHPLDVVGHD